MSYPIVNQAIAVVVMNAKLSVVDDLISYLENKIDVDNDLKTFFEEFKSNLSESETIVVKAAGKKTKNNKKSDSDGEKKKRAPSIFNLYIKDVMPDMKAKHPDIKDGKQMITFASESWKTDPLALFIKDKIVELKKDDDNKSLSVVELYAKMRTMYTSI